MIEPVDFGDAWRAVRHDREPVRRGGKRVAFHVGDGERCGVGRSCRGGRTDSTGRGHVDDQLGIDRWEEERVLDWLIRYWEQARKLGLPVATDFADFYRDFEWMGVQRHIKVLGIFSRLNYRDGKSDYLAHLPLVEEYLRKACERYRELRPLLTLLDEWTVTKSPEAKVGYTF